MINKILQDKIKEEVETEIKKLRQDIKKDIEEIVKKVVGNFGNSLENKLNILQDDVELLKAHRNYVNVHQGNINPIQPSESTTNSAAIFEEVEHIPFFKNF